ncbi:unnamed protein product [Tilletia caries]|nr:unnamed protein product [Tilletia caries]
MSRHWYLRCTATKRQGDLDQRTAQERLARQVSIGPASRRSEAVQIQVRNVARDVCWRAYWIVMAVQTPATTGTHATSGQPPPARLNSSTKSSSTQPPKSPPSIATPYHPLSSPPRGVRVAVRVKKQRGKDSEEGAGKGEVVEIDH